MRFGIGKFSFGSPFNDLPGALSSSASQLPVFTARQQDNVYRLQVNEPIPWFLFPSIFHNAELIDTEWQSGKLYEQLVHMELLSKDGEVNTEPVERKNFGKDLLTRTAFIPQIKSRMVIDFLFWWAEETQRLKKLVADKEDLHEVVKADSEAISEDGVPAKLMLEHVQSQILTMPSQRHRNDEMREATAIAGSQQADMQPPAYQ